MEVAFYIHELYTLSTLSTLSGDYLVLDTSFHTTQKTHNLFYFQTLLVKIGTVYFFVFQNDFIACCGICENCFQIM
jgi:hypothetical protein